MAARPRPTQTGFPAARHPAHTPRVHPDAELLKDVPLFQLLDDGERADLAARLEVEEFPAGRVVFNYGDPGEAVYIVSQGEVEIFFRNDTGETIVLEVAGRGDFFGEISFLDQAGRTASVKARADTTTLRLDRDDLRQFLLKRPEAALDLLAALAKRQRATVERLRHTASRNVNEEMEDTRTVAQKAADWIAAFSGSIPFLLLHFVWFGLWLAVNLVNVGIPQFDPYPFGFLTLVVSLEAIFLSVFVLAEPPGRQGARARRHRIRREPQGRAGDRPSPRKDGPPHRRRARAPRPHRAEMRGAEVEG